eukprot:6757925-Prorocentrum_lima.AAC.1
MAQRIHVLFRRHCEQHTRRTAGNETSPAQQANSVAMCAQDATSYPPSFLAPVRNRLRPALPRATCGEPTPCLDSIRPALPRESCYWPDTPMASVYMGGHNMWGRLAAAGTEPPLWPFTEYFWKLIEENPEINYSMLASALLDEAASTRDT